MLYNLVSSGLYYATPDNLPGRVAEHVTMAHGVIVGLVTGLMAGSGQTFEEAIATLYRAGRHRAIVRACVPSVWHDQFILAGFILVD